jgi:hypothetical protein
MIEQHWLSRCIQPTGSWGTRMADVRIKNLPTNMVANALLTPAANEILLVFIRWDYNDKIKEWPAFSIIVEPHGIVEVPAFGTEYSMTVELNSPVDERKYQTNRLIPRIVFNLSPPMHKRSEFMQSYIRTNRKIIDLMQPKSLFVLLEDDDMLQLVREAVEIPNFFDAYQALRAGSFKADLVRYYLLYKFGGVYHDDKSTIRYSLDSDVFDSILSGEENASGRCDMFASFEPSKELEITYMGTRSQSPIMLRALNQAIKIIMARHYGGSGALGITGKKMITSLLVSLGIKPAKIVAPKNKIHWLECEGELIAPLAIDRSLHRIIVDDKDVLWERLRISPKLWAKPSTYYSYLWCNRQVYTDGNGFSMSGLIPFCIICIIIALALIGVFVLPSVLKFIGD